MRTPPALIVFALFIGFAQPSQAATLLFSHQGAANPTTEGWTYSGNSQTGPVLNDQSSGVDAWRVYDPGAGGSTSGTYGRTLTTSQLSEALTTGWTLDATIRFVPPDSLANTPLSNNAWCTFLVDQGEAGRRDLYGLFFGSDTSGNTLVKLYNSGISYTLSPGYHDYRLTWDPGTGLVSFFIDGELKVSDYSGTNIPNTGTSRVYWGDNSSTGVQEGRGAHYAYVGLSVGTASVVPEPGRAMFLLLSLGLAVVRRHRSSGKKP